MKHVITISIEVEGDATEALEGAEAILETKHIQNDLEELWGCRVLNATAELS